MTKIIKNKEPKKEKKGRLREKVIEAFDRLKEGDLKDFVGSISDVSDVRYGWQKTIVDSEIYIQLKELSSAKGYCKNVIGQHKKQMILEKLK